MIPSPQWPPQDRAGCSFKKQRFAAIGNIRCPVVAKVSPTAGGLTVDRVRAAPAQDQGLLHLLETQGDRLRPCRHCGAWFWRERKREYCEPCFQSGTARSKVHRAKAARASESLA